MTFIFDYEARLQLWNAGLAVPGCSCLWRRILSSYPAAPASQSGQETRERMMCESGPSPGTMSAFDLRGPAECPT